MNTGDVHLVNLDADSHNAHDASVWRPDFLVSLRAMMYQAHTYHRLYSANPRRSGRYGWLADDSEQLHDITAEPPWSGGPCRNSSTHQRSQVRRRPVESIGACGPGCAAGGIQPELRSSTGFEWH